MGDRRSGRGLILYMVVTILNFRIIDLQTTNPFPGTEKVAMNPAAAYMHLIRDEQFDQLGDILRSDFLGVFGSLLKL